MENLINERCLTFKYAGENKVENSKKLAMLLKENSINFVGYVNENYYPCEFVVRRCGKKWNDIMKLVNSIQSPKYDYERTQFYIDENLERDPLGDMQIVINC